MGAPLSTPSEILSPSKGQHGFVWPQKDEFVKWSRSNSSRNKSLNQWDLLSLATRIKSNLVEQWHPLYNSWSFGRYTGPLITVARVCVTYTWARGSICMYLKHDSFFRCLTFGQIICQRISFCGTIFELIFGGTRKTPAKNQWNEEKKSVTQQLAAAIWDQIESVIIMSEVWLELSFSPWG